jgi:Flp pilus assembly protein TadD
MMSHPSSPIAVLKRFARVGIAGFASATLLAACAGSPLPSLAGGDGGLMSVPDAAETRLEPTAKGSIEHWGKAYAKNPRSAEAALNYARRLRASGDKQQAFVVLQQAAFLHAGHRGILSEYGRLALELEQVELAQKLLGEADDPANADWRTISARGTVLAKHGKYREAIPLYERALALAPNQASILNNLALALTMEGKAEQAEGLLKQAVAHGGHEARVNQNLALVLSLQGKYEEAKLLGARQASAEPVTANVDYVKRMVQLEPKPLPAVPTALKAQVSSDAASPEGAAGAGTDTRAAEDWITRVAQVKPGA